jgi:hypothetical protein
MEAGGWQGKLVGVLRAAAFAAHAATYLILNGAWTARVGRAQMNWMAPHALQVLFSPSWLLRVDPLAIVALAGLLFA